MTFSIAARCPRSGMLGIAMATSSPAVGGRCPAVVPGRGVLSVQAVGCPALRDRGADLLRSGADADAIVAALTAEDPFPFKRQLAVVDAAGGVAARTGDGNLPWAGHVTGTDHVALGNILVGAAVVEAMSGCFRSSDTAEPLEARLMQALEAGRNAGGQAEGQTSACLLVYCDQVGPRVDLRVDVHDEPVGELRRIYDWFRPLVPYYLERNENPLVPRYKEWLANTRA